MLLQVLSGVSLPIFIGLLVMMYPVLAKVCQGYESTIGGSSRV